MVDPLGFESRPGDGSYYRGLRIQAYPEVHVQVAKRLRELYPNGARVLDLASGTGSLAQRLLDLGFEVHCTTWNDQLRVDAPTYHLNLDQPFGCRDVGNVPFDAIVASEIIEHVENPSSLLRSCASVLNPDAHLVVTTPNLGYVISRLQWLRRGYPNTFAREEVVHNRHISMIWSTGFEHLADAAGLRLDETRYIGGDPSGLRLLKRITCNVLIKILGPSSAGASCLFVLTKSSDGPKPHFADTTY
jgi:SAM-dependent methyltransferase